MRRGRMGMVPTIAPQYTKFGPQYAIYDDSPEWGSASGAGALGGVYGSMGIRGSWRGRIR